MVQPASHSMFLIVEKYVANFHLLVGKEVDLVEYSIRNCEFPRNKLRLGMSMDIGT